MRGEPRLAKTATIEPRTTRRPCSLPSPSLSCSISLAVMLSFWDVLPPTTTTLPIFIPLLAALQCALAVRPMASWSAWEGDDQLVWSNPEQASRHILSIHFILTDLPPPFLLVLLWTLPTSPFTSRTNLSVDIPFVTCMLVISEGGSEYTVRRTAFGHVAGCTVGLGSVLRQSARKGTCPFCFLLTVLLLVGGLGIAHTCSYSPFLRPAKPLKV